MTRDGQSVERLREYLRNLKPEARAMLIAELERAQLRGDDMAGSELVLEELRRTIRIEAQRVPRIGDAARLFFMPFEPFLIDAPADHKRVGRIAIEIEPHATIGRVVRDVADRRPVERHDLRCSSDCVRLCREGDSRLRQSEGNPQPTFRSAGHAIDRDLTRPRLGS